MNYASKSKSELITFIVSNTPTDSLFDLEFDQADIEMSIKALYDLNKAQLIEVVTYVEQYI
jgi:hypothetical protein